MSFNHGSIWWSELMTRDVAGSVEYYKTVCGWSIDAMPMEGGGDYRVAVCHGHPVAGIMDMSDMEHLAEVPAHWFTYIAVDDVDTAMAQTTASGGQVLRPPFDVPGVGRIVMVKDAGGAAVGLMTPFVNPEGSELDEFAGEPDDDENFPI